MEELYVCSSDNLADIPEELAASGKFSFPEVHINPEQMTEMAKSLKIHNNDCFVHVPFCLTVEAAALGAQINLGDEKNGPRVGNHTYNSLEQLLALDYRKMMLEGERISVVMEAIRKLSKDNTVILYVNGIFTMLSYLVEIGTVYRTMRNDIETSQRTLDMISDCIVAFIEEGLKNGAKIISYSDPVGDITLMGKKTFSQLPAPATIKLLKRVMDLLDDQAIYLCGRMTSGLKKLELIEIEKREVCDVGNMGGGIMKILSEKNVKLIGNSCIKRTHIPSKNRTVTVYPLTIL